MKISYGIICFHENRILLVKKQATYCFVDFVNGRYRNDDQKLKCMFDNMTFDEKLDILSLNFAVLWHKVFHENPELINDEQYLLNYVKKKNKFEQNFVHDKGVRLRYLVENTDNADTAWEIPKGRSDRNEYPINTAIREFYEETGISQKEITIDWYAKPYVYSFIDDIKYKYVFYYGFLKNKTSFEKKKKFHYNSTEVVNMKWFSKSDLQFISENERERLLDIYNYAHRNYYSKFIVPKVTFIDEKKMIRLSEIIDDELNFNNKKIENNKVNNTNYGI